MPTNAPAGVTSARGLPPEAWASLVRVVHFAGRPLHRFLRIQAASGIILLAFAACAVAWSNSPWAYSYTRFWQTPIGFRLGEYALERPLSWVVNDGLMVFFFLVVGIEIRREIQQGELSEWRRAALPAAAALGGMLVPAGMYLAVAGAKVTRSGWGVPMATDIAFAVGILSLLGKRVPPALRVLLLAIAVMDDLGAILIIALFYSSGISLVGLFTAAIGIGVVFAMQRLAVRSKLAYALPAFVIWSGIYAAGVHPTIAGVLLGLLTPVRAWLGPEGFVTEVRGQIDNYTRHQHAPHSTAAPSLHATREAVGVAWREAVSPAESVIATLHPWVAFVIMPLFALANAGVAVHLNSLDSAARRVVIAVGVALVIGKPAGILLASWLTLRLKLTALPVGITFGNLAILGAVAGVGFTMALFISELAFTDPQLLGAAKLGVLIASGFAAMLGLLLGGALLRPIATAGAALTVDEAERSTEL
jgi:Na+:H+ antiporter, NhaA family